MDCDNNLNRNNFCSDDDDDYVDADEDNELDIEDEDLTEPTQCLFCDNISQSIDLAIEHLKSNHNFDLKILKKKFIMDQYSYIKLINYIRTHEIKSTDLDTIDKIIWNDEKYLKPIKYEPWLTYDFEGIEDDMDENEMITNGNMEDELNKNHEIKIQKLKEELTEKNNLLMEAFETIKILRSNFRKIIDKNDDNDEEDKDKSIANISVRADEGYFNSYAHFSIHYDMLADTVRTSSYRDAILNNKEIFRDKIVLDVGCGTSILSMFASLAGAKNVVAIDNSEIIYKAMDIARVNNFTNIIFVKGRLEDTVLPIDKYDIIISEWMGYFLIFEGMLDSIIYARDHHLKDINSSDDGNFGGILMPIRCNITLVGYGDEKRHQEYIQFWDSVYGFDMSTIKKEVLQEAVIEVCNSEYILTEPQIIVEYDLSTVTLNYSNFSVDFNMKITKNGNLTAFVGYFDTFFDLPTQISFSTSPWNTPTHWKQVIFFIEKPINVNKGDILCGKIQCRRNIKDMRSLNISIKLLDKTYYYKMD